MKRGLGIALILLALASFLLAACSSTPEQAPEVVEPVVEEAVEAEPVEEVEPVIEEPEVVEEAEVVEETWMAPENALVSVAASEAPELDGAGSEAVWADAPAITLPVSGGANVGSTEVIVQSAYHEDNVYFLVSWDDPTQDFLRSPWEKQEDGSWARLVDPDNRGGDNNLWYEDKMSFIWPINNSIPNFDTQGCFTACHAGEDGEAKPYGNKYTAEEGQSADIWHWKSVRNVLQIDDQYLDATRYSEDTPGAGRHGDPKDGGGYVNNDNEDKSMPAFMGPEGFPVDGSPGSISDAEKLPFDDSLFVAGDLVPGVYTAPFTGDRGNISANWQYTDGAWTLEFSRSLVTGSEFDVQFEDLTATYYFGVAVFDNAQVRHAFQAGSSPFVFQP
jgi:hypothetical protein